MSDESPRSEQLKRKDQVTGKVIKITLAGAAVDIGLANPAVLPISQLRKEPVRRVEDVLTEGDEIQAWVRRVDEKKGRVELTLIKPLGLEWREIQKDAVLKGTVSKLDKFGAFVEVGAERPGLVHISEMSTDYVKKPEDVVKVGDQVEVKVLDFDRRKKQIKLSMKALIPVEKKEIEKPRKAKELAEPEEPEIPVPTAMEIALRKAMSTGQRAGTEDRGDKPARKKGPAPDMDEILERTLENRVRSK